LSFIRTKSGGSVKSESRLLTLFQLLRDLAAGAQDDPSARSRDLARRRDDIEREIERVREGSAGPLDATEVKERYAQVADTARRLLADFRQVEENFRVLDSLTRERIATSTQPKGALLEEIFGETDHIHRSDQGKSFDAFWEFLMSPHGRTSCGSGYAPCTHWKRSATCHARTLCVTSRRCFWTQVIRSTAQSRNSWINYAVSSTTGPTLRTGAFWT
jgi:hypothetical protein